MLTQVLLHALVKVEIVCVYIILWADVARLCQFFTHNLYRRCAISLL